MQKFRCKIDSETNEGCTALYIAAWKGHKEIVTFLVDHGADAEIETNYNMIPLEIVIGRHPEITKILVQALDPNVKNMHGHTALHNAVIKGKKELISILIDKGYDLNAKDNQGLTPLDLAYNYQPNDKDLADFLKSKGAHRRIIQKPRQVSEEENIKYIKTYISKGGDIDAKDIYQDTELHKAAENRHIMIVEYLLQKGANPNIKNSFNFTPLHIAAEKQHYEIIKLLLKYSADVDAEGMRGMTPLWFWLLTKSKEKNIEVAKIFIAHGADVNKKNQLTDSLLHVAASKNNINLVELLLSNNATINSRNNTGATPLHQASKYGYLKVAEILIANKANINPKDKNGLTPLDHALLFDLSKIQPNPVVELLKINGGIRTDWKKIN